MVSRRSARFCALSDALDDECRRRGHPLRPGAADEILNSRIQRVAAALHIKESSAFATYFDETWPVDTADGIARATEEAQAATMGPPVVMPTILAAQLVSALGVAAKFAITNVENVRADECVLVGSQAGDAVTSLGASLRQGVADPTTKGDVPVVTVDRPAVHLAHDALNRFLTRLGDGSWRDCWCGCENDVDMDLLQEQVNADLQMLRRIMETG